MSLDPTVEHWGFQNAGTPPGSAAYYSVRFAPRSLHDPLAALFGWRHLVRSVLSEVSDRGVAARKLAWWQEELDRILSGTGSHPIARPLARAIARADLPRQPLTEIIWATESILTDRRTADFAALLDRADLDQGALCELIARVHGETRADRLAVARRAGAYCGLVELIRDSGRLLRQGRAGFLPEARLIQDAPTISGDGQPFSPRHLPSLCASIATDLAPHRNELSGSLSEQPVTIRIQIRLADALLAELADSRFEVADQWIDLTPLRKLWIGWREG